jgi:hypothetical protein
MSLFLVGAEGLEDATNGGFTGGIRVPFTSTSHLATSTGDSLRARSLAHAAAKARLLERLLTGDERLIATEIREALEETVGPTAQVIPFGRRT